MKKLLNQTLIYYLIFSSIVLILSGPCFYFLIEKLYLNDVDEAIILRRDEFVKKNLPTLKLQDIPTFNQFSRDTRVLEDTLKAPRGQIFQQIFYDDMVPEWEPYHVLYQNVQVQGKPYTLMVRLNLVESQDLMLTLTWLYLGTLLILLIGNFYLTRLISNKLWNPFYDTLQKIEKFNIEQQNLPVFHQAKIIEFEKLNQSISKLIDENIKAYSIQKEFIENASHELQNPLAIFRNKLDVLLQHPSLNTELGDIIQSLYEVSGRLSKINKNLLLLSKIENRQFKETEKVNLLAVLTRIIPYFEEQAMAKHIQINFKSFVEDLTITANKSLLEILISNLILNAISHNQENGRLDILLSDGVFTVANSAKGKSLNTNALFKRFSKSSDKGYGSGLGLAIVKQIAILHQWSVSYVFENELHQFRVKF